MADVTANGTQTKAKTKHASRFYPTIRTVHKYAGLTALLWLSVLGITGWILDHHDWRWTHQWSVPSWVTSARIDRLVPGTVMRHIEVDAADPRRWIGASERGLWLTEDSGETWQDIPFTGMRGHPQVFRFVPAEGSEIGLIYLATDDGIWTVSGGGEAAERFALAGELVTSLSPGSTATELVGVAHHGAIFRLDTAAPEAVTWVDVNNVAVSNLPDTITLNRFVLDLHVGKGFLPQPWSILINDYGGIAMGILGLTGALFWYLPRRWRGDKPKGKLKTRQTILRWLYRGHGPVIGLLAIVPILYLSITGVLVDHILWLIDYGKTVDLKRESLPPVYHFDTLNGEISHVVAYPDDPDRYSVATRFGVLNSHDGGRSWVGDDTLPATLGTDAGNVSLFREGEYLFVGIGTKGNGYRRIGDSDWNFVDMPADHLAITDASRRGDTWYLKNSRMISQGTLEGGFEPSGIAYPPVEGTTVFLFLADIHTGNIIHGEFIWVNDLVAILAIILALTGPVAWWKRKWM